MKVSVPTAGVVKNISLKIPSSSSEIGWVQLLISAAG
jgi:hypothetical protein